MTGFHERSSLQVVKPRRTCEWVSVYELKVTKAAASQENADQPNIILFQECPKRATGCFHRQKHNTFEFQLCNELEMLFVKDVGTIHARFYDAK